VARLEAALAGLAAVTDQSDLWLFFALSGPLVKEALGRLVPINLSPMTFPVGGVSLTRCGHLDVRVWHVDDQSYELAVARSFADDLRHDLEQVVAAR
jgi:sarcosine oxidase subunit gamma